MLIIHKMLTELAACAVILTLIYHLYVYKKLHYHFDKWGIKYKPGVPFFGNTFCSTFLLKHGTDDLEAVYRAFPEERYVGYIKGMKPIILVRDPELMKLITIKDFKHFVNRKTSFPKEIEPLLGSSILSMKGDEWRKMRSRVTTVFSSSKIRAMVPLIIDISNNIVEYLKDHAAEDIDVLDLMHRFNTDIIASIGFGLQVNSMKDRDNEFFTSGKEFMQITFCRRVHSFITMQFPVLAKTMQFLGIQLPPKKGTQFFRNIVTDTIAYRKKNNVRRPDFLNMLLESFEEWTLDEITGQIYFAFLASFESSSSILTMCIHELALHPDCEERLYQEIRTIHEKFKELTYDSISELKYLDCVLKETSRKWSVALEMDRVCSKTYVMPPPREGAKPYEVHPGDMIYNVVNAIHMDSQHHCMPDVFNPDRFSDENEKDIKSFTFMPFGMGPRSCLGMRFAMLKMKILLYDLILNYRIVSCKKTAYPLHLKPHEFSIKALGGTYVRFEPRV